MLNLFLALCSIVLCFPLGVLLALGRRSKLPLIRAVSTTYIEIVRGAPLFVLLLLANVALQFFIPPDLAPSTVTRAIACSRCSPPRTWPRSSAAGCSRCPEASTRRPRRSACRRCARPCLIVLPQALRNVIPAQIGQLISLFKDTTLAGAAMGLFDLLARLRGDHAAGRVPRPGPDRRDARVRRPAVLDGVVHDEPREPATRAETGSRDPMSETPRNPRPRSGLRRCHRRWPARRGDDRAGGREQVLRPLPGAQGHQPQASAGRRSSSSSARRARASRR